MLMHVIFLKNSLESNFFYPDMMGVPKQWKDVFKALF